MSGNFIELQGGTGTPTRVVGANIPFESLIYVIAVLVVGFIAWGIVRHVCEWGMDFGDAENRPALKDVVRNAASSLGQRKMVRSLGVAGTFHACIVWGMVILLANSALHAITHFTGLVVEGDLYIATSISADVSGLALFVGLVGLFAIKYVVRPERQQPRNLRSAGLLLALAFSCLSGFFVEGARIAGQLMLTEVPGALDYEMVASPIGWWCAKPFMVLSLDQVLIVHRVGWWVHGLFNMVGLACLPFGRLWHIVAAMVNATTKTTGQLAEIEDFEDEESLGAQRVKNLRWTDFADLDACIECGACSQACPANNAGYPLNPKIDIILSIREERERVSAWEREQRALAKQGKRGSGALGAQTVADTVDSDGGSAASGTAPLHAGAASASMVSEPGSQTSAAACLDDGNLSDSSADDATGRCPVERDLVEVIGTDALWSCVTCQACSQACPLGIDHVGKLVDVRRRVTLWDEEAPDQAQAAFINLDMNQNPWGLGYADRADWLEPMHIAHKVVNLTETPDAPYDYLLFGGCFAAYDLRYRKAVAAAVKLLHALGIRVAYLGVEERCCGDSARRLGNEFLYQELAGANIDAFKSYGVRKIVTLCPHCLNTLKNEYPRLNPELDIEVHHLSGVLEQAIRATGLAYQGEYKMLVQEPCYLARYNPDEDRISNALEAAGFTVCNAGDSLGPTCCGGGGGCMWLDDVAVQKSQRISEARVIALAKQARKHQIDVQTGMMATGCPYCMTMIDDALATKETMVRSADFAEILWETYKLGRPREGMPVCLPKGVTLQRGDSS